ncbi:V-type proton ATPase subunit D 1-like [Teleopsis dalmanni]|uniref:V-type proton ATPase subunit D 1-like n=1 Tax=Teleopsis dalmanni TaxID=139649 RepID=UPI0018CCC2FE|nr:V-type proton ATPase subunit D 1-like [Teleopsis dalmanni]XP_037951157.1 V-type proton ATPase subunit D 1-like [Teleopsis dalmanni]
MSKDKFPLFPSRANLVFMKLRHASAVRGLGLLKRKRDAMEMKLKEYQRLQQETADQIPIVMRDAIFALAKGNFLSTDFKPAEINTSERADCFLRIIQGKVLGMKLPSFNLIMWNATNNPLTGLSRGGEQVGKIRNKFQEALKVLVRMASLQISVKVLTDHVRQNNMRVNGLEYVMIPKLINTVAYINQELDELAREEFYRLKCSQRKQIEAKRRFKELVNKYNRLMGKDEVFPSSVQPADIPFHRSQFNADNLNSVT